MNKFMKAGAAMLMACSVFAGCSNGSADKDSGTADAGKEEAKEILVGISPDYPPYESKEGEDIVGFDADMADWVFKYLQDNGDNYTFRFKEMSFDTIVSAIQADQIDLGISGFTYDEERAQNVAFSEPYAKSSQVVVVTSEADIASADDLNGKKVGAQLGSTGENAANDVEGANVQTYTDVKVEMEALKSGALDACVVDEAVAKNYVDNGDYKIVDTLLDEEVYIIANKENSELLEKINTAIKAFKDSDDYETLKEKWGI